MMKENNVPARIEQVMQDVCSYINLKYAALKLSWVEALSGFFSNIIAILIFGLFAMLGLMLFTVALLVWLSEVFESMILAAVILGGFYMVVAVVVLLLRNRIMTDTMVRIFSRMFFNRRWESHEEE